MAFFHSSIWRFRCLVSLGIRHTSVTRQFICGLPHQEQGWREDDLFGLRSGPSTGLGFAPRLRLSCLNPEFQSCGAIPPHAPNCWPTRGHESYGCAPTFLLATGQMRGGASGSGEAVLRDNCRFGRARSPWNRRQLRCRGVCDGCAEGGQFRRSGCLGQRVVRQADSL